MHRDETQHRRHPRVEPAADVASAYVELKRDGREFLLPFHGDRNPSLTIYQARGDGAWRFQCFACGAHGDVIDWIREIENVDFNEAAACRLGARELPAHGQRRALPPDTSEEWLPVLPVPASASSAVCVGRRMTAGASETRSAARVDHATVGVLAYRDADGAARLGHPLRLRRRRQAHADDHVVPASRDRRAPLVHAAFRRRARCLGLMTWRNVRTHRCWWLRARSAARSLRACS